MVCVKCEVGYGLVEGGGRRSKKLAVRYPHPTFHTNSYVILTSLFSFTYKSLRKRRKIKSQDQSNISFTL